MPRQPEQWTRDSEAAAVSRLRSERPAVLVYTRQSKSDFDTEGQARGPSLSQQLADCLRIREIAGLPYEPFTDADRSGKETSKRPGYNQMMERIRTAPDGAIGAIVCYEQDRLHRNDRAFLDLMAEMCERRILVFDVNGLVSGVNKLPWKVMAAVAQDMREKLSQRVRDNLHHLKREGRLLGHAPVGYRREGGKLVRDREAAPVVRRVFELYASGRYSFKQLAMHLNESGIRPLVNPDQPKKHAEGWSSDLLKGMLNNPSYLGKVTVETKLQNGTHPALVSEELFERCQAVRTLHRRRTVPYAHRRYAYTLTPLLRCGRCGGNMRGRTRLDADKRYYQCANRIAGRCDAPWIRMEAIEQALTDDLRAMVPDAGLNAALRARLKQGIKKAPDAKKALKSALSGLDAQSERVKTMFQLGRIDQQEFVERTSRLNSERQAAREKAAAASAVQFDLTWCETQVADLVRVWELADAGQRTRLLASIFEGIEADTRRDFSLAVVAIPKVGWRPYFERVANSPASCTQSSAIRSSRARVRTDVAPMRITYRLRA